MGRILNAINTHSNTICGHFIFSPRTQLTAIVSNAHALKAFYVRRSAGVIGIIFFLLYRFEPFDAFPFDSFELESPLNVATLPLVGAQFLLISF